MAWDRHYTWEDLTNSHNVDLSGRRKWKGNIKFKYTHYLYEIYRIGKLIEREMRGYWGFWEGEWGVIA